MKTRKLFLTLTLIGALLFVTNGTAQEEPTRNMVEITYIRAKMGHEADFIAAVKAHNDAFHNEIPYTGNLDLIQTGRESGWFVNIMGPCNFSDLDNRPSSDAHNSDWEDNVGQHVARFGRTEYWSINSNLSNPIMAIEDIKYETIWFIKMNRDNPNADADFAKFMKMALEVNKKHESDHRVYYSMFAGDDGRDLAVVFPHKALGDLDSDRNFGKEFDAIHGEGSFEKALKLWSGAIKSVNQQLWQIGVN